MKKNQILSCAKLVFTTSLLTTAVSAGEYVTDLTAGGGGGSGTEVGKVIVTDYPCPLAPTNTCIDVTYDITEAGWALTETHLSIKEIAKKGQFPTTKKTKSPIPGKFEFKDSLNYLDSYTYSGIDVGSNTTINVASHAVVALMSGNTGETNLDAFSASLSDTVAYKALAAPIEGSDAYFPDLLVTESEKSPLNGSYLAWCVDEDADIWIQSEFSAGHVADVYSSYDLMNDAPELWGSLDTTGMGSLNWLLNQNVVGTELLIEDACYDNADSNDPNNVNKYTYGDVQQVVWTLIDSGPYPHASPLNSWNQCRVDTLTALANANHDFTPNCTDESSSVAVILRAQDGVQPVVIEVPLYCSSGDETAWGGYSPNQTNENVTSNQFGGSNWATNFTITFED